MELSALIAALSEPQCYHGLAGNDRIEVHQTHISAVFLTREYAYKIKKPVSLGFLDYSTLEARRRMCELEVRLNRRLAADVYLGVVPVTRNGSQVIMEGHGEVVEWAVKMKRLPDDAMLRARLRLGQVVPAHMQELARRLAHFHQEAERPESASSYGGFETVAGNARENFDQAAALEGLTVSAAVLRRLRTLTEAHLSELDSLIRRRAEARVPCDTHGDLRLEHVYHFPQRTPPADWVMVDCIEFNERFRYEDPVADVAFLAMELAHYGHRDLAQVLKAAYVKASLDEEGRALWPFYVAYRAAVRGKVEGMKVTETEFPEAERPAALAEARAYWLLALGILERPERRPCVVLVGGLPGTGKSTLARALADQAGFTVIRSDVVRKEVAGLESSASAAAPFGAGIYTDAWNERTYVECVRRAEAGLFEGARVLIDASFRAEQERRRVLSAVACWGVPVILLVCEARPETARARLAARYGDASDAGWSVYQEAASRWEALSAESSRVASTVATDDADAPALDAALQILRSHHLAP